MMFETIEKTGASRATIEMPRIGSYGDMKKLTGRSYSTITRWISRKKLRPGVYIGQGMFNMSRINELFQKNETIFLKSYTRR